MVLIHLVVTLCISTVLSRELPPPVRLNKDFFVDKDPYISFTKYNTIEEMNDYLDGLSKTFPDLVTLQTIGHSFEGRPIEAVLISSSPPLGSSKSIIMIDGGIHAREWVSPASALFIIQQLVQGFSKNREMLDEADWIIVPVVNPDGYVYSMNQDRMWRKSRANTTNPHCKGVDLNRNFDFIFGGKGTSTNPCDEVYAGPSGFSEPETRAIRDIANKYKGQIKVYLTLHSYGQYFLYPWGYGSSLPKDWKELDLLATRAEKALSSVYGTRYTVGSSGRLLGAAAGGSDDWMKAVEGVKYSYTVELPGGGSDGFDLPERKIKKVVTELYSAMRVFSKHVANNN